MPRVYTQRAGKDYPQQGIAKGDTYYAWAFYRQRTPNRSKTYPTRTQLTQNDFLQTVYSAFDVDLPQIQDADALREIASAIREAGEEAQSAFDELPEGFQQGDNGQTMERRAEAASDCADQIESAADGLEEELARIDAWADYIRRETEEELGEDADEPDGDRPEDLDAAREEALENARSACEEGDWD